MKQEKIDELQALYDAGTQGEWRPSTYGEVFVDQGEYEMEIARFSIAGTIHSIDDERNVTLACELHNLAPALLEAARENLRLREAMNLILKKVVGTQALIENEATEEALSTVEFCLQDIWTVITHPHLVRELNRKETV